jgi:hypothetical protein
VREHVGERSLAARPLGHLLRDSPAVVGDDDLDQAAARQGTQLDAAARRLARPLAISRSLNAVRHGVAQQMHERVGEALQDHPVEFGISARHGEPDVLACRTRQVADRSGQRPGDRRERQRPHLDRGVLQLVKRARARAERIGDALRQLRPCSERVRQPAPILHGLADDIEQMIDLCWRDTHRPLLRDGAGLAAGGPADSLGWDGWTCHGRDRPRGRFGFFQRRQAGGKFSEQDVNGHVISVDARAHDAGGVQQRIKHARRERARVTDDGEDVLDSMSDRGDLDQAEHAGRPLNRMHVAEQRVDHPGTRVTRFDRQQRRFDLVEPVRHLFVEDLPQLGIGFTHQSARCSEPKILGTSMTPSSSPS